MKSTENFWSQVARKMIRWKSEGRTVFNPPESVVGDNPFGEWFPDWQIDTYSSIFGDSDEYDEQIAIIDYCEKGKKRSLSYGMMREQLELIDDAIDTRDTNSIAIIGNAGAETAMIMVYCYCLEIEFTVLFPELSLNTLKSRVYAFSPDQLIITNLTAANKMRLDEYHSLSSRVFYYSGLIEGPVSRYRCRSRIDDNLNHGMESSVIQPNSKQCFTIYTSGTTGQPKGIVHGNKGYSVFAAFTGKRFFGLERGKKILCASDAGWINGHTYAVFSPLINKATTVLIRDNISLLQPLFLGEVLVSCRVDILYLPVTLAKMMQSIYQQVSQFPDLFLDVVGVMGEPLPMRVEAWLKDSFLKSKPHSERRIVNTYFQSETAGILVANEPESAEFCEIPAIGHIPDYMSIELEDQPEEDGIERSLAITSAWPGSPLRIVADSRQVRSYFTTVQSELSFRLRDAGKIVDNRLYIDGRTDDCVKIYGQLFSTAVVESIVLSISSNYGECGAVVTDIRGRKVINVFVSSRIAIENRDAARKQIVESVNNLLKGSNIEVKAYECTELPKTRSGKTLRRYLEFYLKNPYSSITEEEIRKQYPTILDLSTILDFKAQKL